MSTVLFSNPIPEDWERTTLGEVVRRGEGSIQTGPFGSQLHASDYVPVGVPTIMPVNIGENRIIETGIARITEADAERLSKHRVQVGDIIYSRRGDVERRALIRIEQEGWLCGTGCLKVRLGKGVTDPLFASFYLGHPEVRAWIVQHAVGATMPNLNTGIMEAIPFLLPPLREQEAIACILGTLDDKIELNRRRNRTLEAMARAIFQSWFVDFDPVHENARRANKRARADGTVRADDASRRVRSDPNPRTGVRGSSDGVESYRLSPEIAALFPDRFEDSPLGPIPAGWRVGTLGEVADNPRRGIGADEVEAGTPYIALEHMPRRSIALADWATADEIESNKFVFHQGEILFGKLRPYFHKVGIAPVNGVCSTDILVIVPKHLEWFGFCAGHFSSDAIIQHADQASTGTKMPRTNWNDLARFEVAIPQRKVAEAFTNQFKPMIDRIHQGITESRTLAALRDALLPKLISGELRISDAERIVGRAV